MRKLARSFYCITLALICQYFFVSTPVGANSIAEKTEVASDYRDNPSYTLAATGYEYNKFYFESFEADYYLSKADDGTSRLRVVEELTAIFPETDQNHGITRVIPYTNQDGHNLTMPSDKQLEIAIYRNGVAEKPHKIESEDGYFTVYIGSASQYVHGEQVYRLEYEFQNVITEFNEDGKEWQELYWDTNGNDWSQQFNRLTARVHFDSEETASAFSGNAWCYVGKYGTSGQSRCQIEKIDQQTLQFTTTKLASRENLTFDLEFAPHTFTIPPKNYNYTAVILAVIECALGAVVVFWGLVSVRKAKPNYHHHKELFVKPEYAPLKDYTVGEMSANYIGKQASGSSKVATLLELAVQGKVELIKDEEKTRFGHTVVRWKIRIKSLKLTDEERVVLQILNGDKASLAAGQEITISTHTATNELIKLGASYGSSVRSELEEKGLFVEKSKAAGKKLRGPVAISLILIIVSVFIGMLIMDSSLPYVVLIGGVPLVVICLVTPWVIRAILAAMSAKYRPFFTHTKAGLEASRYMDGLKLYISMAEKDRIEFLQSVKGADTSHQGIVRLYEKLLPYAVLFRLEKSWVKELGRYYEMDDVSNPSWYVGVGAFSAHDFSTAISAASSTVRSNITHSTTSSSSSGSSGSHGGGFSGGGGGGGGGGGW